MLMTVINLRMLSIRGVQLLYTVCQKTVPLLIFKQHRETLTKLRMTSTFHKVV